MNSLFNQRRLAWVPATTPPIETGRYMISGATVLGVSVAIFDYPSGDWRLEIPLEPVEDLVEVMAHEMAKDIKSQLKSDEYINKFIDKFEVFFQNGQLNLLHDYAVCPEFWMEIPECPFFQTGGGNKEDVYLAEQERVYRILERVEGALISAIRSEVENAEAS